VILRIELAEVRVVLDFVALGDANVIGLFLGDGEEAGKGDFYKFSS
jgi:hypothetical protein